MRNLLAVLFVGAMAASSFGAFNFWVSTTAPRVSATTGVVLGTLPTGVTTPVTAVTLNPGDTQTVYLWGQATLNGLQAVGGDIVATGDAGTLQTSSEFAWWYKTDNSIGFAGQLEQDQYDPDLDVWTYKAGAKGGKPFAGQDVPGANGGINQLGSGQGNLSAPDATFAKTTARFLGQYTITAVKGGDVTLAWAEGPMVGTTHVGYNGWYTTGTVSGDWIGGIGGAPMTSVGLAVHVTPEPATMALLALGGLLVARRRRA